MTVRAEARPGASPSSASRRRGDRKGVKDGVGVSVEVTIVDPETPGTLGRKDPSVKDLRKQ